MPSVAKQRRSRKPPQAKGKILSRAVPVSDMSTDYLKINIYGQNRVGKTTLACTFPKPLLLISFEPADAGGAESVADVDGVMVLQNKVHFNGRDGLLEVLDELKRDTLYQTHVLDSVTSLADQYLAELLGLETLPEQQKFGDVHKSFYMKRAEILKETLRPLLGLNAHTVILAKERDHRPQDGKEMDFTPKFLREGGLGSFWASDVGGSIAGWIQDACPYICRMFLAPKMKQIKVKVGKGTVVREEDTGEIVHRLRIMYHPNFATGARVLRSKDLPEYLDEPDFDKIHSLFKE